MSFTPEEIRHLELPRAWLRGYRRRGVDGLLEEFAESFEDSYRERADLSHRLHELEAEASKQRELEALLRSTLVSAERAAHDLKDQARRESDLIVQEAHAESRRINREAIAERHRIEEETRRIHVMLRMALATLEDWPEDVEARADQPEQAPGTVEKITEGGIEKLAG